MRMAQRVAQLVHAYWVQLCWHGRQVRATHTPAAQPVFSCNSGQATAMKQMQTHAEAFATPDLGGPSGKWAREESMLRTCSWGGRGPPPWARIALGGDAPLARNTAFAAIAMHCPPLTSLQQQRATSGTRRLPSTQPSPQQQCIARPRHSHHSCGSASPPGTHRPPSTQLSLQWQFTSCRRHCRNGNAPPPGTHHPPLTQPWP